MLINSFYPSSPSFVYSAPFYMSFITQHLFFCASGTQIYENTNKQHAHAFRKTNGVFLAFPRSSLLTFLIFSHLTKISHASYLIVSYLIIFHLSYLISHISSLTWWHLSTRFSSRLKTWKRDAAEDWSEAPPASGTAASQRRQRPRR